MMETINNFNLWGTHHTHPSKHAHEVIEALEKAHHEGRGTIMLNGRLVEHHHVNAAKRLLTLVEMTKELEVA